MAIRTTKLNKALSDECEPRLEEALQLWKDSVYAAAEHLKLKALYEECSAFKASCPVCIMGRRKFMSGLDKLAKGETAEGMKLMKNSFTNVRFKWAVLMSKFNG